MSRQSIPSYGVPSTYFVRVGTRTTPLSRPSCLLFVPQPLHSFVLPAIRSTPLSKLPRRNTSRFSLWAFDTSPPSARLTRLSSLYLSPILSRKGIEDILCTLHATNESRIVHISKHTSQPDIHSLNRNCRVLRTYRLRLPTLRGYSNPGLNEDQHPLSTPISI